LSLISISDKQLLLLLLKLFAHLLSMCFRFSSVTLSALFLRVIQIQTSGCYRYIKVYRNYRYIPIGQDPNICDGYLGYALYWQLQQTNAY